MRHLEDGTVVMTRSEYEIMAAAVAKTEVAGKGKAAKEEKEPSALEKAELRKRIMSEKNTSIRQKLIRENMNLFR